MDIVGEDGHAVRLRPMIQDGTLCVLVHAHVIMPHTGTAEGMEEHDEEEEEQEQEEGQGAETDRTAAEHSPAQDTARTEQPETDRGDNRLQESARGADSHRQPREDDHRQPREDDDREDDEGEGDDEPGYTDAPTEEALPAPQGTDGAFCLPVLFPVAACWWVVLVHRACTVLPSLDVTDCEPASTTCTGCSTSQR